jgi:MFS transporter, PPP family, 3-phenylpropionic acid transporter
MGVILALLPIMGIVSPPIVGALADAMGVRGSLLRIASAVAAIGFTMIALTVNPIDGSLRAPVILFIASLLFASARAPIMLVADVLALESLGAERERYGELRLWGSVGFIAASISVGWLVDPADPRLLPSVIAGLFAASLCVSFALPTSAAALPGLGKVSLRVLLADYRFLICLLLSQASHSAYDVCYSLHLRDLGVSRWLIGTLWAVGVAFEVLLLRKSSALLGRFSSRSLLMAGLIGAAIRWIGITFVVGFWSALAFQPLHALSFACVWIASVDLTARDERLATARGIASASMGIGGAVGLVGCSALYAARSGRWVFAVAAGIAIIAALFAVPRRRDSSQASSF